MKTKVLLFSLFAVTLFALGATVTLLFNSAPSDPHLISAFFGSLFVSLAGLIFFVLLAVNYARYRSVPPWQATFASGRYGLLAALFLTVSLLLRSYKLWNIATGIVLLVIVFVLDLLWRGRIKVGKTKAS